MIRYWSLLLLVGCALNCRLADAQGPISCFAWNEYTPSVRAEGVTELVSDLLLICTGGTPVSPGAAIPAMDLKITFNANVTSRIIGSDGQSSEALLIVDEPMPDVQFPCEKPTGVCPGLGNGTGTGYYGADASTNRNVFQGIVGTGTTLQWTSVPFDLPGDGQYRFYRFTNIRLDATSLTGGATELDALSISLTGPGGDIPVDGGTIPLGITTPSLTAVVRNADDTSDAASGVTVGVASASVKGRVATLSFTSGFPGADKTRTDARYIAAA